MLQTTVINIFSLFFREKKIDVSSESSARQRNHMKKQALFSWKGKSKKLKCRLLQFLFGALRVKPTWRTKTSGLFCTSCSREKDYTVELQWLEHLWDHEIMFETWVVRASEC